MNNGDRFFHDVYGWFEVLNCSDRTNVLIKFDNTGYEYSPEKYQIEKMVIKDPLSPTIYGVGYFGVGDAKSTNDEISSKAYSVWHGMLRRCYSGSSPYYSDCSVCDEWHNFQNFHSWYVKNIPDGVGRYHVDKDIRVSGNRVYSPDTCMIVTSERNLEHMLNGRKKPISLIHKDGTTYECIGYNEAGRELGIKSSNISLLANGKIKQCKGWMINEK